MYFCKASFAVRIAFLFCLSAVVLSAQALSITSPPTLPPASISVGYPPVTLSATGGSPPYTWTLLASGTVNNLPAGLTLSTTGVISGTPTATGAFSPTIRVTDSASNVATQQFSLTVGSGGTLTRTGVIAQVAAGGGWTTTIYLINTAQPGTTNSGINSATVTFRGNNGNDLSFALSSTQQGYAQSITASSQTFIMNPLTSIVLTTTAPISGPLQQGWADIFTTGGIAAFGIFQQTLPNGVVAEGTSAQQGNFSTSVVLPYNNTSGNTTTAALVSLASVPITITATIFDLNGNELATPQMINSVPALGQPTPFAVPTLFPVTAGQAGIILFTNSSTMDPITGIGFSFGSLLGGSFTSVPMLPPL
jgi:large repetitive protein